MATALITTTRDRALCFSILERFIAKQTAPFDAWIVVNDGTEAYKYTMGQTVIRRDPTNDTLPSICENWLAAIPVLERFDKIIVVEDDDAYHEDFVKTMTDLLDQVELAGVSHDVYYKFHTRRYWSMNNDAHASLACTAFRSEVLPWVKRICEVWKSVFIDMYLWCEWAAPGFPGTSKKLIKQPLPDGRMLHVGMKNMPGAHGLGLGHGNSYNGPVDNWSVLAKWIGPANAKVYRDLWQEVFQPIRKNGTRRLR